MYWGIMSTERSYLETPMRNNNNNNNKWILYAVSNSGTLTNRNTPFPQQQMHKWI